MRPFNLWKSDGTSEITTFGSFQWAVHQFCLSSAAVTCILIFPPIFFYPYLDVFQAKNGQSSPPCPFFAIAYARGRSDGFFTLKNSGAVILLCFLLILNFFKCQNHLLSLNVWLLLRKMPVPGQQTMQMGEHGRLSPLLYSVPSPEISRAILGHYQPFIYICLYIYCTRAKSMGWMFFYL